MGLTGRCFMLHKSLTQIGEWFRSRLLDLAKREETERPLIEISESDYFAGAVPQKFSSLMDEANKAWNKPSSELAAAFFEAAISLLMVRIISAHPIFNFRTPVWVKVLAFDPISGQMCTWEMPGVVSCVRGDEYAITIVGKGANRTEVVLKIGDLNKSLRLRL